MSRKNSKIKQFISGPERGVLGRVEGKYWSGLRIATVGGIAAFVGAAIVAFGLEGLGKVIVIVGILSAILGLGYHLILVFSWFTKGRND